MFIHSRKSKTIAGAFLVFTVALLLRLPYINYPPDVVFDEGINTSFTSYYFHKKPFFDYMPPLAPMVFSAALWGKSVPLVPIRDVASPQGDFPYRPLRVLIAVAGSLLAVVIFLIAFLLYRNVLFAALSSSFVIFDNALVVYSRTIVPETLLLLFGFSGILCWMLSDHSIDNNKKNDKPTLLRTLAQRDGASRAIRQQANMRGEQEHWFVVMACKKRLVHWSLFLAAAFLWALAASLKLTGLGFLLTASLFLLYRKQYAKIAAALAVFALVYTAVFFIFFSTIRDSAPPYTHFRNQEIQKIDFSTPKTIANFIPFFIQHHRATLAAHSEVPTGPAIHPLRWPLYHRSIGFWGKSNNERINVSGNMVIWVSTALAVLVTLFITAFKKFKYVAAALFPIPALPLVGYLANYVPFLLVPRALYLYHYFAALIFGFLLLPALVGFFAKLVLDEAEQNKIVLVLILLAILWYIILIPRTYGIPFYSMI